MDDLTCLAQNVYYEARGESRAGQEAVAYVTLNRVAQRKKSICQVVFERHQFSWTMQKRKAPYGPAWTNALAVANRVLQERNDFTGGATHFHSTAVKPAWSRTLRFTMRIGQHLFYASR